MGYTFNFASVWKYWPLVTEGAWTTLKLTAITTVVGVLLGVVLGSLLTSGPKWLRSIISGYVEIIRNTPLLVQAYFVVFGLAWAGARLPVQVAGTLVLIINVGAYTTEIMRAGIESVHRSQIEAAEALGLSRVQTYIHVIIRPAMERVYPALTSQYVLLMLGSSLLSAVGLDELYGMALRVAGFSFRNFEVFVVIAVVYLVLSVLLRIAFVQFGRLIFPRRRKLGTPL